MPTEDPQRGGSWERTSGARQAGARLLSAKRAGHSAAAGIHLRQHHRLVLGPPLALLLLLLLLLLLVVCGAQSEGWGSGS